MNVKNHYLFSGDIKRIEQMSSCLKKNDYNHNTKEPWELIDKIIRSCFSDKEIEVFNKIFPDKNNTFITFYVIKNERNEYEFVDQNNIIDHYLPIKGKLPFSSGVYNNYNFDKKKIEITNKLNDFIRNNPENAITKHNDYYFWKRYGKKEYFKHAHFLSDIPEEIIDKLDHQFLDGLDKRDEEYYRKTLDLFGMNNIEVPKIKKGIEITKEDMDIIRNALYHAIIDKLNNIKPSDTIASNWISNAVNKIFPEEEKEILTSSGIGSPRMIYFNIGNRSISDFSSDVWISINCFDINERKDSQSPSYYLLKNLNEELNKDATSKCLFEYKTECEKWINEYKYFEDNILIVDKLNTDEIDEDLSKILKIVYQLCDDNKYKDKYESIVITE